MIVTREHGAQGPVDQAHDEHFGVRGSCFPLEKAAGETTRSCVLLAVVDRQGEKVHVHRLIAGDDGGEEDGVARTDDDRTVCLLGELAGFDGNLAPIAEIDGLIVNVHFASSSTCVRAGKPQYAKGG